MSSVTQKTTKPDSETAPESGNVKRSTMNDYYDWASKGTCSKPTVNKDLFISSKPKDKQRARIFCEVCKVKRVCLAYALSNHEEAGIWGGIDFGQDQAHLMDEIEELREAS